MVELCCLCLPFPRSEPQKFRIHIGKKLAGRRDGIDSGDKSSCGEASSGQVSFLYHKSPTLGYGRCFCYHPIARALQNPVQDNNNKAPKAPAANVHPITHTRPPRSRLPVHRAGCLTDGCPKNRKQYYTTNTTPVGQNRCFSRSRSGATGLSRSKRCLGGVILLRESYVSNIICSVGPLLFCQPNLRRGVECGGVRICALSSTANRLHTLRSTANYANATSFFVAQTHRASETRSMEYRWIARYAPQQPGAQSAAVRHRRLVLISANPSSPQCAKTKSIKDGTPHMLRWAKQGLSWLAEEVLFLAARGRRRRSDFRAI